MALDLKALRSPAAVRLLLGAFKLCKRALSLALAFEQLLPVALSASDACLRRFGRRARAV